MAYLLREYVTFSDRNGYTGTRFNTRYPASVRYPGTRVALNTRLIFFCEISKRSVFMYRLHLFKVTQFTYRACLHLTEFARNVLSTCLLRLTIDGVF